MYLGFITMISYLTRQKEDNDFSKWPMSTYISKKTKINLSKLYVGTDVMTIRHNHSPPTSIGKLVYKDILGSFWEIYILNIKYKT